MLQSYSCTSSPLVPAVPSIPGRPLSPFSPSSPVGPTKPIIPMWPCSQRSRGHSPLLLAIKTEMISKSGWLTFSPLSPESPLNPGRPGGPCKQSQINQLADATKKNGWQINLCINFLYNCEHSFSLQEYNSITQVSSITTSKSTHQHMNASK